jgi:multiple sugar transport system substrate-binding protein
MRHHPIRLILTSLVVVFAAAASAQTIDYWLWDSNQQPAYEACAAAFTEQNPGITVRITQQGWGDYWTAVTTGLIAGTAPDVFTNHLAYYPQFAENEQILDLAPLIERDGVPTDIYVGELVELWGRDGAQYGLPKDWDTVAIIYNKEMVEAAGISEEEMNSLTWNPQDGGTFQEVAARLTLDRNGNDGLSPDFDRNNVVRYGYANGVSAFGQTEWSHFAASNGWRFNDGLYATEYYFDDPRLAETIQWLANLSLQEGYAARYSDVASLGAESLFTAGQAAMTINGSWMIGWFINNAPFEVGFARLPIGPEGRKSMFNGLADAIYVGSRNQEAAWEWVKFMASPECQTIVGSYGVVFPAIQSGVDAAIEAYEARGVDVSAFTLQALEEDGTFLFPITDHGSEVASIMQNALDSIFLGQRDAASALEQANREVNALFR